MRKKSKKIITFAAVVFVAIFLLSLRPVTNNQKAESFRIDSGEGLRLIAARLENNNLIRSRVWFTVHGFISGRGDNVRPGLYQLSPAMSSGAILKLLSGGPVDIQLTITEGETIRDIDYKLSEAGIIMPGEFFEIAQDYEGFLFPDTYRFSPSSGISDIIKKFLENFDTRVRPVNEELADTALDISACLLTSNPQGTCTAIDSHSDESYNELIVASLIEKEVVLDNERAIVAGILNKRLSIGMPIQIDATIVYVICGGTFRDCPKLKRSDFQNDSLYNTYTHAGLPPTPISNPGLSAIKAATFPKTSSYLYYLSDPNSKRTIFSGTFEEHNDNRARYLGL